MEVHIEKLLVQVTGSRYTCFKKMARKFFRFSTQELETLFSEKADNIEVLMDLEEELNYRKTDRAARLAPSRDENGAVRRGMKFCGFSLR